MLKDRILPRLGMEDEPGLLLWRNLGPGLESAYLLLPVAGPVLGTGTQVGGRQRQLQARSGDATRSPQVPWRLQWVLWVKAHFIWPPSLQSWENTVQIGQGVLQPGFLSPISDIPWGSIALCCREKPSSMLASHNPPCCLITPAAHTQAMETYPGCPQQQLWLSVVQWPPDLGATPAARPWHTHPWGIQPWSC